MPPHAEIRVLLARHGATVWNAEHRIIGSTDLPLSAAGRAEAALIARRIASERPAVLYTSPLLRARQTAEMIAVVASCPVYVDERLRETDFGAWEGLTMAEAEKRDAAALAKWRADPSAAPTGGEAPDDMRTRVRCLLDDLRTRNAGQTVALVGHGGVFQALIFAALDLPFRNDWVFLLDNGSLSELALSGTRGWLVRLNDTAHLAAAENGSEAYRS